MGTALPLAPRVLKRDTTDRGSTLLVHPMVVEDFFRKAPAGAYDTEAALAVFRKLRRYLRLKAKAQEVYLSLHRPSCLQGQLDLLRFSL